MDLLSNGKSYLMRDNIRQSITDYVERGVPLGDFLTLVMQNDLFGAVACADEENARDMREIVQYIYNEVPSMCHGSRERARAWLDKHADARHNAARDANSVARELLATPDADNQFVCGGCGQDIDPETCGCGDPRENHGSAYSSGHVFIPMGCDCARVHGPRHDEGVTPDERGALGIEG